MVSCLKNCIIGALLLSFAAGCLPQRSLFEPESMPREKVATAILRTPSAVLREGEFRDESDFIRIVSVDGKEPTTLDNRVVLPPGKHAIQVAIEIRRSTPEDIQTVDITRSDTSLSFTAAPDGNYLIDAELNGLGLWVWIIDEEEKLVVAGRHPTGRSSLQIVEDPDEEAE